MTSGKLLARCPIVVRLKALQTICPVSGHSKRPS
jgi:hypothetical protein